MSLIQLRLNAPELFEGKNTAADVAEAATRKADYESSAPTGVVDLPSFADIEGWEQQLIGLYTNTGQVVTPEKAKRCATVLAIIRGLMEDVSTLGLGLYKRGDKEDKLAFDHPVYQMLNMAPNEIMTPLEVREHIMLNFLMWGQFFNLKRETVGDWDTFGQVTNLWPLSAAYVTRRYRELVWTFTDPTTGLSGEFTPDLVWRGSILSTNGIDGFGITTLAKEAIGLLLAAEQQGARLFRNGVQTDIAITTDNDLDDDDIKRIRKDFMARFSGSQNAFMPIITDNGLKVERLGLTAQESQYLEARGFQVAEIARVFRYPEVLLGTAGKNSKSSTYASAEQFFDSYTKHTLGPWATRIEQTIHRDLLSTKERAKYYARHDFSSLLRANETGRIANWNAKITGGWASRAEARKAEGMPWVAGLDQFILPAGTVGMNSDPQQPDPTPTDQSALALARRVAFHIVGREQKALVGTKQNADEFYTNFGAYIESLSGADTAAVREYKEMRRTTEDRFSTTAVEGAVSALVQLCIKGHSK